LIKKSECLELQKNVLNNLNDNKNKFIFDDISDEEDMKSKKYNFKQSKIE
jgi:hypothetical protein